MRSKVNVLRVGNMFTDLCTIIVIVVEPVVIREEEE